MVISRNKLYFLKLPSSATFNGFVLAVGPGHGFL